MIASTEGAYETQLVDDDDWPLSRGSSVAVTFKLGNDVPYALSQKVEGVSHFEHCLVELAKQCRSGFHSKFWRCKNWTARFFVSNSDHEDTTHSDRVPEENALYKSAFQTPPSVKRIDHFA